MLILGIETSCDETAAAIVQDGTKIISSVVASSQAMHAKFGGIIPDQAAREQLRSIIPVIHECLLQSYQKTQKAGKSDILNTRNSDSLNSSDSPSFLSPPNIEAIAVTVGPGLIGSLLVGVETAKALALAWNKPIIPVNHLIGHIYANWLIPERSENSDNQKFRKSDRSENLIIRSSEFSDRLSFPSFPALVLLVSGGHTELILMSDHGKFKLLGSTRDDAAGECFDKCARLLNLGYPGGPAVEAAASKFQQIPKNSRQFPVKLPRPMIHDKNFDFSFSGLKTAVSNVVRSTMNREPSSTKKQLAYELQEAVTDVLVSKTLKAAQKYSPKSILLAGGVAANLRLREKFTSELSAIRYPLSAFYVPPVSLCTDNAAYIASAAFFNYHSIPISQTNADPGLNL